MASQIIHCRGEKYRVHAKVSEAVSWLNQGWCSIYSAYQVVGVHKETGELAFDVCLQASSPQDAMDYFAGYFHKYDLIDAWPVFELIEDQECLERRLKYQLSRRNSCTDPEKYIHTHRANREAPRKTIQKLRALKTA